LEESVPRVGGDGCDCRVRQGRERFTLLWCEDERTGACVTRNRPARRAGRNDAKDDESLVHDEECRPGQVAWPQLRTRGELDRGTFSGEVSEGHVRHTKNGCPDRLLRDNVLERRPREQREDDVVESEQPRILGRVSGYARSDTADDDRDRQRQEKER